MEYLEVLHKVNEFGMPQARLLNIPSLSMEMTPQQLLSLADALIKASGDCYENYEKVGQTVLKDNVNQLTMQSYPLSKD